MQVRYKIAFWIETTLNQDDPLLTDAYAQILAERAKRSLDYAFCTVLTSNDDLITDREEVTE